MAQIQTSTSRGRFASIPRVRGSNYVSGQEIAAASPNVGQLGDQLQRTGHVGAQIATDMNYRQQDAKNREARSVYMELHGQHEASILSQTGAPAFDAVKQIEETQRVLGENAMKSLDHPLAQEMFNRWRMEYDAAARGRAAAHAMEQTKLSRLAAIEQNLEDYRHDIALHPDDVKSFAGNIQKGKADIAERYYGQPENVIAQKQREFALAAIKDRAAAIAGTAAGPEAALASLNIGVADAELGEDKVLQMQLQAVRAEYGKASIEAAKKESAARGRELGIGLGERCNSEIEIERALYDMDKEIADIARTEANRILKARLSAGEVTVGDDHSELVRDIAATAGDKAGVYELVDAIPGLNAKERKELVAEVLPRFEAIQARLTAEEKETQAADKLVQDEAKAQAKEFEAEAVRANATAIASNAQDEADVQTMTDYMIGVTQEQRERIRVDAVARLKVKNARIARERAEAEAQAMEAMEKSEWDPAAISPEWSSDLQRKMEGLAIKNRKPDYSKAMEYCAMEREQLQGLIKHGEWPDVMLHVKGINSGMYNKLVQKAYGDDSEKGSEMHTLDTELNRIKRDIEITLTDTGRDLDDDEKRTAINRVLNDYSDSLTEYMEANGLEKVVQVPSEVRKRLRAASLLTYNVETPGMIYGTNITPMTRAEAAAAGHSVRGVTINPGSLPSEYRQNYVGGDVVTDADVGGKNIFSRNVPVTVAPDKVQDAYRMHGTNASLVRDLKSGAWLVIGKQGAYVFNTSGTRSKQLEPQQVNALANALGRSTVGYEMPDDAPYGWTAVWNQIPNRQ